MNAQQSAMSAENLRRLADDIRNGGRVLFVTGAGLSVASGIAPYRGSKNAIWSKFVLDWGTKKKFKKNPARWWNEFWLRTHETLEFLNAVPNAGHYAIAHITQISNTKVMTQNIDQLHLKSGLCDGKYIEVHGRLGLYKCTRPGCQYNFREYLDSINIENSAIEGTSLATCDLRINPPTCPACGEFIMPMSLFFDESYTSHTFYQWDRAAEWLVEADTLVFVGTSFSVGVTQTALEIADSYCKNVYSFNLFEEDIEELSNLRIRHVLGPAELTLPELSAALFRPEAPQLPLPPAARSSAVRASVQHVPVPPVITRSSLASLTRAEDTATNAHSNDSSSISSTTSSEPPSNDDDDDSSAASDRERRRARRATAIGQRVRRMVRRLRRSAICSANAFLAGAPMRMHLWYLPMRYFRTSSYCAIENPPASRSDAGELVEEQALELIPVTTAPSRRSRAMVTPAAVVSPLPRSPRRERSPVAPTPPAISPAPASLHRHKRRAAPSTTTTAPTLPQKRNGGAASGQLRRSRRNGLVGSTVGAHAQLPNSTPNSPPSAAAMLFAALSSLPSPASSPPLSPPPPSNICGHSPVHFLSVAALAVPSGSSSTGVPASRGSAITPLLTAPVAFTTTVTTATATPATPATLIPASTAAATDAIATPAIPATPSAGFTAPPTISTTTPAPLPIPATSTKAATSAAAAIATPPIAPVTSTAGDVLSTSCSSASCIVALYDSRSSLPPIEPPIASPPMPNAPATSPSATEISPSTPKDASKTTLPAQPPPLSPCASTSSLPGTVQIPLSPLSSASSPHASLLHLPSYGPEALARILCPSDIQLSAPAQATAATSAVGLTAGIVVGTATSNFPSQQDRLCAENLEKHSLLFPTSIVPPSDLQSVPEKELGKDSMLPTSQLN